MKGKQQNEKQKERVSTLVVPKEDDILTQERKDRQVLNKQRLKRGTQKVKMSQERTVEKNKILRKREIKKESQKDRKREKEKRKEDRAKEKRKERNREKIEKRERKGGTKKTIVEKKRLLQSLGLILTTC